MKKLFTTLLIALSFGIQCQNSQDLSALFQSRNYDKVIEIGKQIIEKQPNNFEAYHLIGRSLVEKNNFEEAIPYLEKSKMIEAPKWMQSWSFVSLGVCHYYLDDTEKARTHLIAAIGQAGTSNSVKSANSYLVEFQLHDYFGGWKMVETENIRFHFQQGITNGMLFSEAKTKALKINNQFFGATLPKKIDYYVWSKPSESKVIVGKDIGFAVPKLCIINSRENQSDGHEITHILSHHAFKPIKKNHLINEGVAVAFDLSGKDRMKEAKKVFTKKMTIKSLMKNSLEYPENICYPIAGAFIQFLRSKKGDETLKVLIKEQTWENLVVLYGEGIIAEFEEMMR